jgi:RNA polymerase sigma-70 factor (ECF subfamily)
MGNVSLVLSGAHQIKIFTFLKFSTSSFQFSRDYCQMDIIQQQTGLKIAQVLYPGVESLKKQSRKHAFMTQFRASRHRIYAFILTYVPHHADAADVLQETALLLWNKFDAFTPGSDFTAWAVAVARNKVLKLQSSRYDNRVRFDSEIVERLTETVLVIDDSIDIRRRILADCVRELPGRDAELIRLRYDKRISTVTIAKLKDRPLQGLYKTMARIHRTLRECVQQNLKREMNQ